MKNQHMLGGIAVACQDDCASKTKEQRRNGYCASCCCSDDKENLSACVQTQMVQTKFATGN